jgi:peptide/nickel transport system substrate-binding protein
MFQVGWIADYPHPDNLVVPFMASYGTFAQFQGYDNPELDAKIKAAFEERDPMQQQAKYHELQEIYHQDAIGIMLCQPLGRRYFTKYIEGFYYNAFVGDFALPLYYMSKSES